MADTFNSADALAQTTRTLIYGPVAGGTTVILFAGTFSNVDTTNKSLHKMTLEKRLSDNVTYIKLFTDVPIEYGGSSKAPKIILKTGQSLYFNADANSVIQASINVLERT